MIIELLMNIPVSSSLNMTKGKTFTVVRNDLNNAKTRGVWVRAENGEEVKVLPHEFKVIDAVNTDKDLSRQHVWNKQNLVTLKRNGAFFDVLKCDKCGITAKRYGLAHIVIDAKYKHPDYVYCDTAVIRMESRRKKNMSRRESGTGEDS